MKKIAFTLLLSSVFSLSSYATDQLAPEVKEISVQENLPDLSGETAPITNNQTSKKNGAFDVGLGIGFADIPEDFAVGWDVFAGREFATTENWNIGAQLHYLKSFPEPTFDSFGLNVTARPENKWLSWLQLRAGIASVDYSTQNWVYNYANATTQKQRIDWSGTGGTVGAGIVVGEGSWKLHLLDVEHFFVAGHSFDVYTISVFILFSHR